jgi:uncharacterized membrane protein YphA (DoxX/SURF4 family)
VVRKDSAMWGSSGLRVCVPYASDCRAFLRGARRYALQRLYSTFPGGRPGIGLLLLRVAVGLAATAVGVLYLFGTSNPSFDKWLAGLTLAISGAALAIGFLTPYAGVLVGICFMGIAFSWLPAPSWGLHDARLAALGMIITAVAISLLGPGAFSLDGRLFGRREIVIPPSSRPPES